MRLTGSSFPAFQLVTFAVTLHWLSLAGMCTNPNSQRCLHEAEHPEVTKLKWQVQNIFPKRSLSNQQEEE